jgi:hypothetical protein
MSKRLIYHHLPAQDTSIYFLSSHSLGETQLKTIEKMHGHCQIVNNTKRYPNYDSFKKTVLGLTHKKEAVGIYIVIKQEW